MNDAALYRIKAAELHAKAKMEPSPKVRAEFEALAESYIRLSEQAERNRLNNIVYESPNWMLAKTSPPPKNDE